MHSEVNCHCAVSRAEIADALESIGERRGEERRAAYRLRTFLSVYGMLPSVRSDPNLRALLVAAPELVDEGVEPPEPTIHGFTPRQYAWASGTLALLVVVSAPVLLAVTAAGAVLMVARRLLPVRSVRSVLAEFTARRERLGAPEVRAALADLERDLGEGVR
jgi:hypothetical protein